MVQVKKTGRLLTRTCVECAFFVSCNMAGRGVASIHLNLPNPLAPTGSDVRATRTRGAPPRPCDKHCHGPKTAARYRGPDSQAPKRRQQRGGSSRRRGATTPRGVRYYMTISLTLPVRLTPPARTSYFRMISRTIALPSECRQRPLGLFASLASRRLSSQPSANQKR